MKDLIHLQNCHVTQHTNNGIKGEWKVLKNITNEELFVLPGNLSEKDVFTCLEFARKYEQIAFEVGISFQKKISTEFYEKKIEELLKKNDLATKENERLATKLEQLILKEPQI